MFKTRNSTITICGVSSILLADRLFGCLTKKSCKLMQKGQCRNAEMTNAEMTNAERTIVRCELELLNQETFPAFVSKTGKKIRNGLNPELSACSLPNQ